MFLVCSKFRVLYTSRCITFARVNSWEWRKLMKVLLNNFYCCLILIGKKNKLDSSCMKEEKVINERSHWSFSQQEIYYNLLPSDSIFTTNFTFKSSWNTSQCHYSCLKRNQLNCFIESRMLHWYGKSALAKYVKCIHIYVLSNMVIMVSLIEI